ncbi:MAG: RluA family pseudouridine synthase [Planctomycetota bacterium]
MSRLYKRNRDLSEPLDHVEVSVQRPDEGRFDTFLAKILPWRSRAGARQLIEEGRALLNGERRKPSSKVRAGDRVRVDVRRSDPGAVPPDPEVRILYEDEHLMALDKPGGVIVHPVGSHQQGTLLQELHRRFPGEALPKLAHRLDQFTSGVLLVAKSDPVRAAFSDMLERGEVQKTYEALLLGRADWEEREVSAPIGPVGDSRILMRVDRDGGKTAESTFRARERFAFATHADVRIRTGRTHQIRVHAAFLGHPLLGDHLYGDGIPVGAFERFALHARAVRFRHPVTGEERSVEAPRPEPFEEAILLLRQARG